MTEDRVAPTLNVVRQLNDIAQERGQSLAEMALAWLLRQETVASVLIGASRLSQLQANVRALDQLTFSAEELKKDRRNFSAFKEISV